jgi:hypothetical protein
VSEREARRPAAPPPDFAAGREKPDVVDLPPFDVLGLLRRQLAETEEPRELSAAEIAALPLAGMGRRPIWMKCRGGFLRSSPVVTRSSKRLSYETCRLTSGLSMRPGRGRGSGRRGARGSCTTILGQARGVTDSRPAGSTTCCLRARSWP